MQNELELRFIATVMAEKIAGAKSQVLNDLFNIHDRSALDPVFMITFRKQFMKHASMMVSGHKVQIGDLTFGYLKGVGRVMCEEVIGLYSPREKMKVIIDMMLDLYAEASVKAQLKDLTRLQQTGLRTYHSRISSEKMSDADMGALSKAYRFIQAPLVVGTKGEALKGFYYGQLTTGVGDEPFKAVLFNRDFWIELESSENTLFPFAHDVVRYFNE